MTYNFDPDRWYENQRRALEARRAAGEVDGPAYEAELARLEARYDEMTASLDKPFEVSGTRPVRTPPPRK